MLGFNVLLRHDLMNKGIIKRSIIVISITMIISFLFTAQYYYEEFTPSNYICKPSSSGLSCMPDYNYESIGSHEYESLWPIARLIGSRPTFKYNKRYLVKKYQCYFGEICNEEGHFKKELKKWQVEMDSLSKSVEGFERDFIIEAIEFSFKWTIIAPFVLFLTIISFFSIKNFILIGRLFPIFSSKNNKNIPK